ncbi:MAG: protein kinase [Kofleriaceae bacterium]
MAAGGTDDTLAGTAPVAGTTLTHGTHGTHGPHGTDGIELVAGRYRIMRWLGGGGMGRVYEAVDIELDERVALKVLRPGLSEDAIERFRREVKLTRRIQHRNVARMFDIGEHHGEKFLTMELVAGESLRPGGDPLPWPQLQAIAEQICAGLAAAHATGVVHRDLKPDNILLETGTGRAVITDFGIARTSEDSAVTQVGAVIGTPRYMSPEQLAGGEVDARSDLFSLGVMLFELATGERPWPGDNAIAVAVAQATTEPRTLDTRTTELPPAFGEIIAACLQLDPDQRPATAAEVGAAIASGHLARSPSAMPAPRARAPSKPPPRESPPVAIAAPPTSLGVLPTQCAPEDHYLAEGMREDLTDTLSTTPGLRVRPAGHLEITATTDPRAVGRDLAVDHVVVSTLRRTPHGLRIAARLINVADGFQIWASKAEVPESEILAQAEQLAHGIAQALSTRAAEATRPTDPRAVEHYLRARAEMRHFWGAHVVRAAEHLEQAVAYAPTSAPILGAYAFASVMAWVMSSRPEAVVRARKAIDRALPYGHGEAYLAAASYWTNQGDPERGAHNLGIALLRAPMSAHAQELAGRIVVEVEGLASARHHFETAIGLDPGRSQIVSSDLARLEGLTGEWDSADARVQALLADPDPAMVQLGHVLRARLAAWRGRGTDMLDSAARFVPRMGEGASKIAEFMTQLAVTGTVRADAWQRFLAMFTGADQPQRQQLMGLQLLTEGALMFDRFEVALDTLSVAASRGLMDRVWMDHCPLFVKIAQQPRYLALHDQVARRAERVLAAFRATQTG